MNNITPKIYSYIRFSTPEQALGDSERRQLAAVRDFAKRKNLTFDESLRMTDKGLSGYHGIHRKRGVLGAFLKRVQNNEVAPGSILVVENIDRLSREGACNTLREIIFELWDHNITLQTLSSGESYERGCDNHPKFLALLIYMQRAHDESLIKSERVQAAREFARRRAREEGRPLTARCPAWLFVKDSKFVQIPEAVKTIKSIFELNLKGIGKRTIAKKLNATACWANNKEVGWRASYIQKILQNPAVIGQYQPFQKKNGKRVEVGEPIDNYYPIIIDENLFYAVQQKIKANKGKGGRTGKACNLFKHLVKCPYCGGTMTFIRKGKSPRHANYLVCDNGRRGNKCKHHSIRYDEVEKLILENCKGFRADMILPNSNEQSKLCAQLQTRINGHKTELGVIETHIENLTNNLSKTSNQNMVKRYESKISDLDSKTEYIKKQLIQDENALAEAESAKKSFFRWKRDLTTLISELAKGDIELRMRTQDHLKQLIDRIEVFTDGFTKEYDCDATHQENLNRECIAEELEERAFEADPKFAKTSEFKKFVKATVKRRMSKEGRFVRVYFKGGKWCDLVPEGSIASGTTIFYDRIDKGTKFVYPDVSKLWNEFKSRKMRA